MQSMIPQINMIYMDPPFYSKNKYRARIKNKESVKLVDVYDDRWDSLSDYLSELDVQLKLAYAAHRRPSPCGTIPYIK